MANRETRDGFTRPYLDEFYRGVFRKKINRTLEELQAELDAWREDYNQHRSHQSCRCYDKTSRQTFDGPRVVGEGDNPSVLNPARTRCLSNEFLTYTEK
jgi:hypothetical protein